MAIELRELRDYQLCPEKERRRKLEPTRDSPDKQYQNRIRTLLIRYYGELLGGVHLGEKELRRSWSTMWEIPVGMVSRSMDKSHSSLVSAAMTPEERMILRGADVIHHLVNRTMHVNMNPVIVDEPFSLKVGELTLLGHYDLVFEDARKQFWIVDWTDMPGKYEISLDRRHAVMIEAFRQRTGRMSGVLVDYIRTAGDFVELSGRTTDELARQVEEAHQMAIGLSLDLQYRSIGTHCRECPYKFSCIGVNTIEAKGPRGRPRGHAVSSSNG
jgi:hypothetical protein